MTPIPTYFKEETEMPVTPVDDRQTDYLALVRQGYDNCAADYCAARSGDRELSLIHI